MAAALSVNFGALADTTTLAVTSATQGASNAPVTMLFPVTRTGDLSYEAVLNYHTADGTAVAGTDYSATTGSLIIPVGVATASIPVTIAPNTGSSASQNFQMVLDSATGIGPAPSFAAPQSFPTESAPSSVAAIDINGDGKPDLIVVNTSSDTVSVFLNTTAPGATTPTFAAQQVFTVGKAPEFVAVADVNGDGKPDLIVANYVDSTVSVLLNTTLPGGAPSFAPQQTFGTGNAPNHVAVADINGDGSPDLIVTNGNSTSVSVLLNNTAPGAGTPSFAVQKTFAVGGGPQSVTTADLNGDGKPDLVVTTNGNTVSVLLNTTMPGATTPSFSAAQSFAAGNLAQHVSAADVNGDGKPDLIVANGVDNTVSVLINITAPGATMASFAGQQAFAIADGAGSLAVVDVNGDDKPDLIVLGSTISVLRNITVPGATTASFAAQQTFAAGVAPDALAVADVNGDGRLDLIVTDGSNNTVSVLLGTTNPLTATTPNFASQQTIANGNGFLAADLNGDGEPDGIVVNGNNTISVQLNTTVPGSMTPTFGTPQTFATSVAPNSIAVGDINGDGMPDLIVLGSNSGNNGGAVSVLLNTTVPGGATMTFAVPQTFQAGIVPQSVTIADLNGDGKPDLFWVDNLQNAVIVMLNTTPPGASMPSFAAQQSFPLGLNQPYSVVEADLNRDGKPDLIVATNGGIAVLLNATAPGAMLPNFAAAQTFATGNVTSVATADVNGDGKPDLIVTGNNASGQGTVLVLLNATAPGATTLSFSAAQSFAAGMAPGGVTTADVNGDGKPDLIVANSAGVLNIRYVEVLLNTTPPGATTPYFTTLGSFASGETGSSTWDLNGDGKPDLVVYNPNGNTFSVLINTQYEAMLGSSPAIGTIVHDYIFANGFQ